MARHSHSQGGSGVGSGCIPSPPVCPERWGSVGCVTSACPMAASGGALELVVLVFCQFQGLCARRYSPTFPVCSTCPPLTQGIRSVAVAPAFQLHFHRLSGNCRTASAVLSLFHQNFRWTLPAKHWFGVYS